MSDQIPLPIVEIGTGWMRDRACKDSGHEEFFVKPGHVIKPEVKDNCRGCPVRMQCLTFAYQAQKDQGCWGGLSGAERASMGLNEALEYIEKDTAEFKSKLS